MFTNTLETAKYLSETDSAKSKSANRGTLYRLLGWLAIIAGVGFAAWNFYVQSDYVAATATLLVSIGAANGFRRGFLGIVITLVALIIATQFALPIGKGIEHLVTEKLGTKGILNRGVAVLSAGAMVYLAFNVFVSSMLWVILGGREKPVLLGRALGALFGVAQWTLAIAVGLGAWLILEPTLQQINSPRIPNPVSDSINSTCLRPLVERYNPILMIPELQLEPVQEVSQTLTTLSDPKSINKLLAHPSVEKLHKNTKVERLMHELKSDPEIFNLLRSREPFDTATIASLLQNETLLKLVDSSQFRKAARKAIREMNASISETTP